MADSEQEEDAATRSRSEIAYMLRRSQRRRSVPEMMRVLARLDREEMLGRLRALSTLRPSERG